MDDPSASDHDLHALIVDDDDVDRERLARLLSRGPRRIKVVEAASQAEALERMHAADDRFDIVFLDFGLNDGDGRDLVPRIHGEVDPDCPIVAVTGHADEHDAAASIKSGMSEFLTKRALTAERVAASIEEGIAWRRLRQDLRRAEEELTHRGLHDPLTDLPNRTLLFDRLGQACARARRAGDPFAIVMLDLDRFKDINDTWGHAVGDMMLVALARRLRGHLREVDTIARLGGDEFAILLQGIEDDERAMAMAVKLVALIEEPVFHRGRMLRVGASLGVALCPSFECTPGALMSAADEAMYAAKRGPGKIVIACRDDPRARDRAQARGLLADLEDAMAARAVAWHWQPMVGLADGRVLGFEALVRWDRADRGPVPADQLIATLEQSPLLEAFTAHCLDTVLGQYASVIDRLADAAICINVSARMLERPGFVAMVVDALAAHAVAPGRLTLELTETALIANPAQARRVIEQLRGHGVRLAIDDFGAGYTSFGYLRDFTISEIKIDRSFIARLPESRFDQSLVTSLVVLCESLGIPLVAEGVEDDRTRDMLAAMGCTAAQGYGIARPMAFEHVLDWLSAWRDPQRRSAA